jgi:hypothetical protein
MPRQAPPTPAIELEKKQAAAEAKLPRRNTYKVVGPRPVAGKSRGEIVELDMTPEQIKLLIGIGHIAPLEQEADTDGEAVNKEGK